MTLISEWCLPVLYLDPKIYSILILSPVQLMRGEWLWWVPGSQPRSSHTESASERFQMEKQFLASRYSLPKMDRQTTSRGPYRLNIPGVQPLHFCFCSGGHSSSSSPCDTRVMVQRKVYIFCDNKLFGIECKWSSCFNRIIKINIFKTYILSLRRSNQINSVTT